eukprot:GHVP01041677.1.p1 GENE.GHVP01041677.1~~GHVP01041677.1.p1  ORF type:complete len:425 (+),score=69.24 GHVP01041677.1:340-1614(+)
MLAPTTCEPICLKTIFMQNNEGSKPMVADEETLRRILSSPSMLQDILNYPEIFHIKSLRGFGENVHTKIAHIVLEKIVSSEYLESLKGINELNTLISVYRIVTLTDPSFAYSIMTAICNLYSKDSKCMFLTAILISVIKFREENSGIFLEKLFTEAPYFEDPSFLFYLGKLLKVSSNNLLIMGPVIRFSIKTLINLDIYLDSTDAKNGTLSQIDEILNLILVFLKLQIEKKEESSDMIKKVVGDMCQTIVSSRSRIAFFILHCLYENSAEIGDYIMGTLFKIVQDDAEDGPVAIAYITGLASRSLKIYSSSIEELYDCYIYLSEMDSLKGAERCILAHGMMYMACFHKKTTDRMLDYIKKKENTEGCCKKTIEIFCSITNNNKNELNTQKKAHPLTNLYPADPLDKYLPKSWSIIEKYYRVFNK